ncbi:unnamed protein product [Durusdinium trenchii]|uniref:Methyltransferase domain-containing protein n=1 Tax=Durusdinium trenchii TaxID=1381693 RepID=A0ABP0NUB5_9DINO
MCLAEFPMRQGGTLEVNTKYHDLAQEQQRLLKQYLEHSFNNELDLLKSFDCLFEKHAGHLRVKEIFETVEVWKKVVSHLQRCNETRKSQNLEAVSRIYDIASGHGLLAVLLAYRFPQVQVVAVDREKRMGFDHYVEVVNEFGEAEPGTESCLANLSFVVADFQETCCEAESKPAWEVLAQVEAEVKRRGPLSPWGPVVKEVEIGQALRLDPELKEEDLLHGIILQLDDLPEQLSRAISREAFLRDLQWCPRNFLHRYRLAFKDLDDIPREAIAPLPDDLRSALDKLQPMDPWSASIMAQWLDPTWRCKAWNEIDVMPKEISDENIRRDKQERYPNGDPLEVHERRVDPFDGKWYSLAQLLAKYQDEYSTKDIKSYWRNAMRPNEYKVVD